MPDEPLQESNDVAELEPLAPEIPSPDEALEASDAVIAAEDEATVITEAPPAPTGQTLAMDFDAHAVIMSGGGPLMVRRDLAMRQWIEKCLRTVKGSHPIHPINYGIAEPLSELIGLSGSQAQTGEMQATIRDALVFHPAISDVADFEITLVENDTTGDASLAIKFTALLDDDSVLDIETTLAGEDIG